VLEIGVLSGGLAMEAAEIIDEFQKERVKVIVPNVLSMS
jgi:hypothetical protein